MERPWVKFSKFWHGETLDLSANGPESFLPGFFTHLGALQPKIQNWAIWPSCDQMVSLTGVQPKPGFGPFVMWPWVKFSKFWHRETLDLYANGPKNFPSGFFTHFRRFKAENYELVFLTAVWRNGAFDRPACNQNPGSVLLTVVRLFSHLSTFDQWCD